MVSRGDSIHDPFSIAHNNNVNQDNWQFSLSILLFLQLLFSTVCTLPTPLRMTAQNLCDSWTHEDIALIGTTWTLDHTTQSYIAWVRNCFRAIKVPWLALYVLPLERSPATVRIGHGVLRPTGQVWPIRIDHSLMIFWLAHQSLVDCLGHIQSHRSPTCQGQ